MKKQQYESRIPCVETRCCWEPDLTKWDTYYDSSAKLLAVQQLLDSGTLEQSYIAKGMAVLLEKCLDELYPMSAPDSAYHREAAIRRETPRIELAVKNAWRVITAYNKGGSKGLENSVPVLL